MNKSLFAVLLVAVFMGFVTLGMRNFVMADEAAAAAATPAAAENSDVIDLTSANFDQVVGSAEFALVEFYAPWCPHCKKLVPEYEVVATELKPKNIVVAKVDCDKEQQIGQKFEIPGFPTIKLFKNGKPFRDYDDERTSEAMIRWVIKKTGPATIFVANKEELDALVAKATADRTSGSTVVVGTFAAKDSDAAKLFVATADRPEIEEFQFVQYIDAAAPAEGKIELHRPFEPKLLAVEDIKSVQAEEDLIKFVKENGYPLVDEINGRTFRRFAESNLPLAIAFFDMENKEQVNSLIETLTKVAEQLKGKLSIGYSDGKMYAQQLEVMGGNATQLPGLAAMNIQKRQNFPFLVEQYGELNADNILKWAQGIVSGEIKPHMRSEPIPEKNDEPVKIVVGKNYNDIVMDNTKDVLLEVYAPWCGHCKKLAPVYDELAKFFSTVSNLVIAKVDGTQNDTPLQIEGFPTLMYFPAGKKDAPIDYQGSRTLKDLKQFIKKNASDAIKADVDALVKSSKKKKGAVAEEPAKKDEL